MRRTISISLALVLFTGSVAAFACDAYCAPAAPMAADATAAHNAHAHHHSAAAPGRSDTENVLAARTGHPPQCSMTAAPTRPPRIVRSTNGGAAAQVTAQAQMVLRPWATESSATTPSPPLSPPQQRILPLRI